MVIFLQNYRTITEYSEDWENKIQVSQGKGIWKSTNLALAIKDDALF